MRQHWRNGGRSGWHHWTPLKTDGKHPSPGREQRSAIPHTCMAQRRSSWQVSTNHTQAVPILSKGTKDGSKEVGGP